MLSKDQAAAFEKVVKGLRGDGNIAVLTGPAGSGKTTLVRSVIEELTRDGHHVVLGAPTGKAALRLSEVTEMPASTMHRLLYGRVGRDEDDKVVFKDPSPPCAPGDRIILDEASMIGSRLFEEFQKWIPPESSILYVGDKEQLEPVRDTWGPDLDNPTALLTEVHRQALDNPILEYATWIREGKGYQWTAERFDPRDERVQAYSGIESAADWLVERRVAGDDATLLAYTHATREMLNARVRLKLGLDDAVISPGDRLCVKANHKHTGLRNGELVTVVDIDFGKTIAEVQIEEWHEPLYIKIEHIEKDNRVHFDWKRDEWERVKAGRGNWGKAARTIHVHYGQALTVHAAQGSQWDHVGFAWDGAVTRLGSQPKKHKRLLYTAVTRAVSNLAIFAE